MIATLEQVVCAFCRGDGVDPFGVMSAISTCSICGGSGRVLAPESRVECAFCGATGVQPGTRLSCGGCHGKGWHELHEPAHECLRCEGSGRDPHSLRLACVDCHGSGVKGA